MNGSHNTQLHFDFRTGRATTIVGPHVSVGQRETCSALNRERIRGIKEATRPTTSREPIEAARWYALVARRAQEWGVPLISLTDHLGIEVDSEGVFHSRHLSMIGFGAEASAWADFDIGCVYKLFELHPNASIGKRIDFEFIAHDNRWMAKPVDGDFASLLEKLSVLHDAGACPTEIQGISDSGDFVLVKQPLCSACNNYQQDKNTASEIIKSVVPRYALGKEVRVFWLDGQAWCIGDLHERNVMKSADGTPTIINALLAPIPPVVLALPAIRSAINRAKEWRLSLRDSAGADEFDAVPDDEL